VTVTGAGGQAQFRTAPATSDLAGFITQRFASLGAPTAGEVSTGTSNGVPFAYSTVGASASGRAIDATIVAYRFPSATYSFTLITQRGQGVGAFAPLVESVAALSASEAAAIKGKRIRIVTVKAGDTIDTLARQMAYPTYQRERFVTLNGLGDDARLSPGMLVKLVVTG
jgi:predicted Zn-dependent protease